MNKWTQESRIYSLRAAFVEVRIPWGNVLQMQISDWCPNWKGEEFWGFPWSCYPTPYSCAEASRRRQVGGKNNSCLAAQRGWAFGTRVPALPSLLASQTPSPDRKQENCQVQGIPMNLKHVVIGGPHDRQNIRGPPQFFTHCLSLLHPVTSGKGGSSGLTEIEAESNYILINKWEIASWYFSWFYNLLWIN